MSQDRQKGWEGVGLVERRVYRAFFEERHAEVEVWKRRGREGFDEDVYDYIWVVETWVELVAGI